MFIFIIINESIELTTAEQTTTKHSHQAKQVFPSHEYHSPLQKNISKMIKQIQPSIEPISFSMGQRRPKSTFQFYKIREEHKRQAGGRWAHQKPSEHCYQYLIISFCQNTILNSEVHAQSYHKERRKVLLVVEGEKIREEWGLGSVMISSPQNQSISIYLKYISLIIILLFIPMGNQTCLPREKTPLAQMEQRKPELPFNWLQNLENDEAPSPCLQKKINWQFSQVITASKDIMSDKTNLHKRQSACKAAGNKQNGNFWHSQLSTQIDELLYLPVFKMYSKMKVKKPSFQMIQIDPKNFIVMKETPIHRDYDIRNEIGKGGFGSVYKAYEKNIEEMRAVKKIKKKDMDNEQKLSLINEFEILKRLDHPNIIKLYDIYEDSDYLYVVTELCEGGDLLQFANRNTLTNTITRQIVTQIISAVSYMHRMNILHRDLKLQNVVIVKKMEGNYSHKVEIKIIDFGISVDLSKYEYDPDEDLLGTLIYMAPESFKEKLSLGWDMWSCGIIFYMMTTKKMPYAYKDEDQLVGKIIKGDFIRKHLQKLPLQFKIFLVQCLQTNPKNRITAEQSLKNGWLRKESRRNQLTQSKRARAATSLLTYDAKNNLVSMIESYLVCKKINQAERQRLALIFQSIDEDKSGIIDIEEFKKFYAENSEYYDVKEVEELLDIIDKNRSGKIDFNEFISAMYSRRKLFQLKSLEEAFDFFDKDRSGELSKAELRSILEGIQNEEVEYLFKQLDCNNDEHISKKQFINYLFDHQSEAQSQPGQAGA